MSTVSKTEYGICLSVQAFARELKCCRRRLGDKIKAAGLKPAGTGQTGHPTYRMADIVEMLINETLQKAAIGGDPEQWAPRDRLDHYRAENERLKFEESEGQLVPIDKFRDAMATTFKTLVLGLETLPDRIEIAAGLDANQVAVMVQVIDSKRQMLYDALVAKSASS